MSERDERWGSEDDEVVRRLRDKKPRISAFELDRIKTTVMSRVRPSASRRSAPRSRLLVAFMTVGLMVVGTAGTIAASNTSFSSGTGAAQSQYRPPKCNPHHEECKCPDSSIRQSRDRCVCPPGETFHAGNNDCFCPDGSHPRADGGCKKCPDGATLKNGHCQCPDGATVTGDRCTCPDHGKVVGDKCRRDAGAAPVTHAVILSPTTPTLKRVTTRVRKHATSRVARKTSAKRTVGTAHSPTRS